VNAYQDAIKSFELKNNTHKAIIILTPGFPESESDTSCLPERQSFIKALQKADPLIKVIILTFQYPFRKGQYLWNGIEVYAFGGKNKSKLKRAVLWISVWQKLKKLKRRYRIKGLLSFWLGECAFVGHSFARKYNLKHYIWLLGQDAKAGNRYVNYIKPKGDSIIALSDFLAEEFFKNYLILPKHVLPTGVDPDEFDTIPSIRTIDICGAGSLIPLKRYELFIEVVKQVVFYYPDLKVVLIGDGAERSRINALIETYGLKQTIEVTGEIPHKKVLEFMQRSKIFLHTSEFEGFATVISEALYAGAHVVSFCKPMEEKIDQLYIAENIKEMIQIVIELLRNHPESKCVLPYNVDTTARQVLNLFIHEGKANLVKI
jgi:glycosyltransferase involved in cell wall biosynthesis